MMQHQKHMKSTDDMKNDSVNWTYLNVFSKENIVLVVLLPKCDADNICQKSFDIRHGVP